MKTAIKSTVFILAMACTSLSASAVVGPVNISLKSSWNNHKPARANSPNSMSITFRFNKDIKIHDTIRVWYPTSEAVADENLKNSICDSLPPLNGELESPRFLPNSKYFQKYPESKEKTICKLYNLEGANGAFDWFIEPGNDAKLDEFIEALLQKDKYGAIKEESGLGWWLMGTVMPSLPIDQQERFEKLVQISRRQGVGFHWCYELGFPGLVNNDSQRSIICRPTMEVESWRAGYNPLAYTSTSGTGIISPATPGRYRIALATTPEPEPVESEAYVLPCSKVSDVKCSGFTVTDDEESPEILFKTGEGGALDAKFSTITIRFKNLAMTVISDKSMIKINGSPLLNKPVFLTVDGCLELTMIVPVNINSMSQAKITFDKQILFGAKPITGEAYIEVMTSSESEFVRSELIKFENIRIFPNEEFTPCSLVFSIHTPQGKAEKNSKFSIIFPTGFSNDRSIDGKSILVDGKPLKNPAKFTNNNLLFDVSEKLADIAMVYIDESAKLITPSVGFYYFAVSINRNKSEMFDYFIKTAKPRTVNLEVSRSNDKIVSIEFEFRPSSFGSLDMGDWVSLRFPKGFKLSSLVESYNVTIDQISSQSVRVDGQSLFFDVPTPVSVFKMSQFKIKTIIDLERETGIDDKIVLNTSKDDCVELVLMNP